MILHLKGSFFSNLCGSPEDSVILLEKFSVHENKNDISIFFSILLIGIYRNYIPALIQTHWTGLSADLQNNWNMGNLFLMVCTVLLIDKTDQGAGSLEISAGPTQQTSSVRYWTSPPASLRQFGSTTDFVSYLV